MKTLGFAMCGSFCTLSQTFQLMETLREEYNILPIMSENVYKTDTRFGKAKDFIERAREISGNDVLHTIVDTEPIGPKSLVDLMLVAPCTGNTLSKIAGGITDTSVTMAVKSSLRINIPVLLAVSSNDAISGSGSNLTRLINLKNIFVVPMKQDDPIKKPYSLVSDFDIIPEAVKTALEKRQLQPIFR
jgi:Archaeal flavoproteins